ncbi:MULTISPECIES: phage baseplate protein [Aurantimonas]|uniref:phage baseplate protein n=1 Tax=Aurantimonas TaxID=182269 RepID=UPI003512C0E3
MSAILFSRAIGPVPIAVVESEQPESVLSITEIPLENGAVATDHAHMEPERLAWNVVTDNAAVTWQALKAWQAARIPFTVVSGFDVHTDLLIKRIAPERTSQFSRVFRGKVEFQKVLIVSSASVPGDASASGESGRRGSEASSGGGKNPGGAKSRRAATPAASRASGPATVDRASGTVNRGDARTTPVPADSGRGSSIAYDLFGP